MPKGSITVGSTSCKTVSDHFILKEQDTIKKQILYNGRVWRNLYHQIRGDQFLFSNDFLPATVTMNGKLFKNISVKYDILNDEILTSAAHNIVLQLNKEMVDMFTLQFGNNTFQFEKLEPDTINMLTGYVNVLQKGNVTLYVKYRKEILLLAVENRYDLFFQSHKIYLMKNGILHQISGKSDLLSLLSDRKPEVKNFIKKNKIRISKKIPESFVPVIEFYNNYNH